MRTMRQPSTGCLRVALERARTKSVPAKSPDKLPHRAEIALECRYNLGLLPRSHVELSRPSCIFHFEN